MRRTRDDRFQFVPSRVEGLPDVTSVTVFSDRIEIVSEGSVVIHRFAKVARWPMPGFLWRFLHFIGLRWRPGLIANRDWFQKPADRYFQFFTSPPLKVFMPRNEIANDYISSFFLRLQTVVRQGGFDTIDLG
jgi:hypothetical protein